jgi:dienelactone hydrolase
VLADDPRVDPNRIAVVGLGAGGRAALHAAARRYADGAAPAFAAHAALYPGCGALAAEGAEPPAAPALVLLPDAEEPRTACAELESDRLLLQRLEGATYAWDLPAGVGINGDMRRWSGGGSTPIRPDPAAAAAAEDRLLRFLRAVFGGG